MKKSAALSFLVMVLGAAILMLSPGAVPAFVGMMILGTGMGIANAAVFELVPVYVPEAVGGASGWIGGLGGAGTLLVVPALGGFVDVFGPAGYSLAFVLLVALSASCAIVCYDLRAFGARPAALERRSAGS